MKQGRNKEGKQMGKERGNMEEGERGMKIDRIKRERKEEKIRGEGFSETIPFS